MHAISAIGIVLALVRPMWPFGAAPRWHARAIQPGSQQQPAVRGALPNPEFNLISIEKSCPVYLGFRLADCTDEGGCYARNPRETRL